MNKMHIGTIDTVALRRRMFGQDRIPATVDTIPAQPTSVPLYHNSMVDRFGGDKVPEPILMIGVGAKGPRRAKNRIFALCPVCGESYAIGNLAQHTPVHSRPLVVGALPGGF